MGMTESACVFLCASVMGERDRERERERESSDDEKSGTNECKLVRVPTDQIKGLK